MVASAIINNHVQVLSDGTPWRPLVHVLDMSRAIRWAIDYNDDNLFLAVNIGSKEFTYQVRDFAKIVTGCIPGSKLSIATDKAIDSRSYKVDFSLYGHISGNKYYPKFNAEKAIKDLIEYVRQLNIPSDFRVSSNWMRLKYLENRIKSNVLDENLYKIS